MHLRAAPPRPGASLPPHRPAEANPAQAAPWPACNRHRQPVTAVGKPRLRQTDTSGKACARPTAALEDYSSKIQGPFSVPPFLDPVDSANVPARLHTPTLPDAPD